MYCTVHTCRCVSQLPGQSLISSRLIPHVCPAAVSVSPGSRAGTAILPFTVCSKWHFSSASSLSCGPRRTCSCTSLEPLRPPCHTFAPSVTLISPSHITLSLSLAPPSRLQSTGHYPRTGRSTIADSQCQHHTFTSVVPWVGGQARKAVIVPSSLSHYCQVPKFNCHTAPPPA